MPTVTRRTGALRSATRSTATGSIQGSANNGLAQQLPSEVTRHIAETLVEQDPDYTPQQLQTFLNVGSKVCVAWRDPMQLVLCRRPSLPTLESFTAFVDSELYKRHPLFVLDIQKSSWNDEAEWNQVDLAFFIKDVQTLLGQSQGLQALELEIGNFAMDRDTFKGLQNLRSLKLCPKSSFYFRSKTAEDLVLPRLDTLIVGCEEGPSLIEFARYVKTPQLRRINVAFLHDRDWPKLRDNIDAVQQVLDNNLQLSNVTLHFKNYGRNTWKTVANTLHNCHDLTNLDLSGFLVATPDGAEDIRKLLSAILPETKLRSITLRTDLNGITSEEVTKSYAEALAQIFQSCPLPHLEKLTIDLGPYLESRHTLSDKVCYGAHWDRFKQQCLRNKVVLHLQNRLHDPAPKKSAEGVKCLRFDYWQRKKEVVG